MNLALFGGTFDPVHRGHLKVARAAADHFALKEVWFVPADIPPHKQKEPITLYEHRYAMTALAVAGEKTVHPLAAGSARPERRDQGPPAQLLH